MACLSLAGCDEKLSDVAGPTPNLEPKFSSINRDILQASDQAGRTACISCHGTVRNLSGLVLTEALAYNNLLTRRGRTGIALVTPGEPENSYLIHKLAGRADISGVRMPQNGPPYLTAGQIAIIKHWIQLGAKND